jgi:hypothetical protein
VRTAAKVDLDLIDERIVPGMYPAGTNSYPRPGLGPIERRVEVRSENNEKRPFLGNGRVETKHGRLTRRRS